MSDLQVVKHLKRGTHYEVLGKAFVQAGNPIRENDDVVVYRDEAGTLWVRPMHEFYDGRFAATPRDEFHARLPRDGTSVDQTEGENSGADRKGS